MRHSLFFMVFQICFCNSLGQGHPESCFFCMGTPACVDPMDYSEVWPRPCFPNDVCLKYIKTSKNQKGEIISHSVVYRKCYPQLDPDEDTCATVKYNEIEVMRKINHTLSYFECSWCDTTNCNSASSNMSSLWFFISLCMVVLYRLS